MSATNEIATATANYFDSQKLKTGTTAEQAQEKMNWQTGEGSSVYVSWVPDELLPASGAAEGPANRFFGRFGKISRIEFVPKFNADRKQTGNMAFIHYERFNPENPFAKSVAEAHPAPFEATWSCVNRFGKGRDYKLKCCINLAAIHKVEYNASQLTDMFERLNTRVMTQMQQMQMEIDMLKRENADLKRTMNSFVPRSMNL